MGSYGFSHFILLPIYYLSLYIIGRGGEGGKKTENLSSTVRVIFCSCFNLRDSASLLLRRLSSVTMNISVLLLSAAAAAASAKTLSASSSSSSLSLDFFSSSMKQASTKEIALSDDRDRSSSRTDKFAPRFDGLRFIETLVTAHR